MNGDRLPFERALGGLLRSLASLKLAVVLIGVLAAVLAVATFLESAQGREYAQWYVYKSRWFIALLALLGTNILAATMLRFPWRRQLAFAMTHAGLLVLLGGSIATFLFGVEGHLILAEGQSGDSIRLDDRTQFVVAWQQSEGRPAERFLFHPGPVDWPEGKTLDFGQYNGVHLRVLKFIRHAQTRERRVEDASGRGQPAVQFALRGSDGRSLAEAWLDGTGEGYRFDPLEIEMHCAAADTLLEDFLNPPDLKDQADGVLALHHAGKVQRISVREQMGQEVTLADGVRVELVKLYPDVTIRGRGQYESVSDKPNNPALELLVHLPDKEKPNRQLAYARTPLFRLDGMHGWSSPVKFWYHHPAIKPAAGLTLLQTSDGRLHYRIMADGKRIGQGEAKSGLELDLPGGFRLAILSYLPHAQREVSFEPATAAPGEASREDSAVLVQVSAGGATEEVWLKRGNSDYEFHPIKTPEGVLGIAMGYERYPLGFSLKLKSFRRDLDPGMMEAAGYTSEIELTDRSRDINREAEISMNQPLVHGRFTFYQSSYDQSENGTPISILTAAYDPGRPWKYLGSIMACGGAFLMFYRRVWKLPGSMQRDKNAASAAVSNDATPTAAAHGRRAVLTSLIWAVLAGVTYGETAAPVDWNRYDWDGWREVAILHGGRAKPLDTLATETFRALANRASFSDPESDAPLDAVALHMILTFSWPGFDQPQANPHTAGGMGPCSGGGAATKPDRWDTMPLLPVEFLELRERLELSADQKRISPAELAAASIVPPGSETATPFLPWVTRLLQGGKPASVLEQKAAELADRYQMYLNVRRGRTLQVLPSPDDSKQVWMSLYTIAQGKVDDKTPGAAARRAVQTQWLAARRAFLADDPDAFNAASALLFAALREHGSDAEGYPSLGLMQLEVLHNRIKPFRLAWGLMFATLVALAAYYVFARKSLYAVAWVLYGAGIVAMFIGFGVRMAIGNRAPVTNMYETVVYVGLGVAVFGAVLALFRGNRFVLGPAALLAGLALLIADSCPAQLDSSLRPLPPVLRSNFWLTTHVLSITLSYAAFALALGLGNIVLGQHLRRTPDSAAPNLSRAIYRLVQVGVGLLAVGTFLGGVWADYAWGRFWGWDPKEVWALVSLLGYLALLHARYVGWVRDFGMAAGAVLCFSLVIMAWYGVNFVLGSGLHSYGFSGGGTLYVATALILQMAFVGFVLLKSQRPRPAASAAECESSAVAASASAQPVAAAAVSASPFVSYK